MRKLSCTENVSCRVLDGLFIRYKESYRKIKYHDILWLEASGSYCYIYLVNGEKLVVVHPLLDLERKLPKERFIRIHRSYIVNAYEVTRIDANVLYISKTGLAVSASYRSTVFTCFEWLENKRQVHEAK